MEYKALQPGEKINRCSAILANGCQCPRAGEFKIVEGDKVAEQQICARCMALNEAEFVEAPRIYPTYAPEEEASSGEAAQEKELVINEPNTESPRSESNNSSSEVSGATTEEGRSN